MTTPLPHIPGPVLVTGASGFTGGRLARELAMRGATVRALVRPGSNVEGLAEAGVEIVHGQLTRRDDCLRAADGTRTMFHIAAAYRTARQPNRYYHDVNVGGTENVVHAAQRCGAGRLVHCSTAGVHGHIRHTPADEDAPINPGDTYQATKAAAERCVQAAIDDGLPAVIARPGAIYGPGDLRLLKLFRTLQQRRLVMFGNGRVHYHLVYIDDLVDGFLRCATAPEAVGQTFTLAGPRFTTLKELVSLVAAAVGAPPPRYRLPLWPLMWSAALCEGICRPLRIEPPLHRRRADFFVKNRAFSIDKARRVLDWEPRIGPEEGLQRTARWYMEHGLLTSVPREHAAARPVMTEVVS